MQFQQSPRQRQEIQNRYGANMYTIKDDSSRNKGTSRLLTILLIVLTVLILTIGVSVGGYFVFRHVKSKNKVEKKTDVNQVTSNTDEETTSLESNDDDGQAVQAKSQMLSFNQIYFKNMQQNLYGEIVGYIPGNNIIYDSLLTLDGVAKLFEMGPWTIEMHMGHTASTPNLCQYFETKQTRIVPQISNAVNLCKHTFKLMEHNNEPLRFYVFSNKNAYPTQRSGVILQLQALIFQIDNAQQYALTHTQLQQIAMSSTSGAKRSLVVSNIPSTDDILQNRQLWISLPANYAGKNHHALLAAAAAAAPPQIYGEMPHPHPHQDGLDIRAAMNSGDYPVCNIDSDQLARLHFVKFDFRLTIQSGEMRAKKWNCQYQSEPEGSKHSHQRKLTSDHDSQVDTSQEQKSKRRRKRRPPQTGAAHRSARDSPDQVRWSTAWDSSEEQRRKRRTKRRTKRRPPQTGAAQKKAATIDGYVTALDSPEAGGQKSSHTLGLEALATELNAGSGSAGAADAAADAAAPHDPVKTLDPRTVPHSTAGGPKSPQRRAPPPPLDTVVTRPRAALGPPPPPLFERQTGTNPVWIQSLQNQQTGPVPVGSGGSVGQSPPKSLARNPRSAGGAAAAAAAAAAAPPPDPVVGRPDSITQPETIRLDKVWWDKILTHPHTQCTRQSNYYTEPPDSGDDTLPCSIINMYRQKPGFPRKQQNKLPCSDCLYGCGSQWRVEDYGQIMIMQGYVASVDSFKGGILKYRDEGNWNDDREDFADLFRYPVDSRDKLIYTRDVPFWGCDLQLAVKDDQSIDFRRRALLSDEDTSNAWNKYNIYMIIGSTIFFIMIGVQSFYWLSR